MCRVPRSGILLLLCIIPYNYYIYSTAAHATQRATRNTTHTACHSKLVALISHKPNRCVGAEHAQHAQHVQQLARNHASSNPCNPNKPMQLVKPMWELATASIQSVTVDRRMTRCGPGNSRRTTPQLGGMAQQAQVAECCWWYAMHCTWQFAGATAAVRKLVDACCGSWCHWGHGRQGAPRLNGTDGGEGGRRVPDTQAGAEVEALVQVVDASGSVACGRVGG